MKQIVQRQCSFLAYVLRKHGIESQVVLGASTGPQEAFQTSGGGHDTSRALFFLREWGQVLKIKRALLCLLQNLGGGRCMGKRKGHRGRQRKRLLGRIRNV